MEENKTPPQPEILENQTPDSAPPASNTIKKTSRFSIKAIVSTIIFLLLAGGAAAGFVYREEIVSLVTPPQQKACTMEAKLCPDGSSVGRSGPNCEFSPCPTPNSSETIDTSSWKTYKSKIARFPYSFKYPPTFTHTLDNATSPDDFSIALANDENNFGSHGLYVHINSKSDTGDTYNFYLEKIKNLDKKAEFIYSDVQNTKIDGKSATFYYATRNPDPSVLPSPGTPNGNWFEVILFENGVFYNISYRFSEQYDKNTEKETFDQILSTFEFTDSSVSTSPSPSGGKCVIAGCSGQLCVEEGSENGISTCEYKEEYACYKLSTCERQINGECGWAPNPEFKTCIENAN